MYHIFINEKCLTLRNSRSDNINNRHLTVYFSSEKSIEIVVETLEQDTFYTSAEIIYDDVKHLWKSFKKQFEIIEAAGGIVINDENKLLMIYRRNKWDLPKGKIESGEKKEFAAVREVQEECGIQHAEILKQLQSTYHIYPHKGHRILKITYWYEMKTSDSKELIPQAEEDITQAGWVEKKEAPVLLKNSYATLKMLMDNYLKEQ